MEVFIYVGVQGFLLAPTRSLGATHRKLALARFLLTPFDSLSIKHKTKKSLNRDFHFVRREGIEPPTIGLKGHCSTS